MNSFEAWNKFLITGKVKDYLNYKKAELKDSADLGDDPEGANYDGWTDTQTPRL